MRPSVISVGNINIDISFYTPRFPEKDSEIEAEGFSVSHGGGAANFATGISRLGIECGIVGCVGRDRFGMDAVASLREEGVWTQNVLECDTETGTVGTIVERGGGTRTMIAWRGANRMLLEAVRRADLSGSRHVHISNVPREVLFEVMERKGKARVSFDPGGSAGLYDPEDLEGVDFILLNESELRKIVGDERGTGKLLAVAGTVVEKQGARGATLYMEGSVIRSPAFKADVVDTTGAGDAFDAGFVSALLYGNGLEAALRWGCAAAALKIQRKGAREGLPRLERLLSFLGGSEGEGRE
ncbi:MAG: carbohydrate kinase family protein [Candidatus Methanosuratincola sp.]